MITGRIKAFPGRDHRPNATSPDRDQPFREFTVVYHDEIKAVQAFPQFEDPVLQHTLYGVRDGFAINYGTAGWSRGPRQPFQSGADAQLRRVQV